MKFSDKVVYQIYPKSFCDTNGDGWGDLAGITSKLDYLKQLGVDYLWITPFFPSPQRDNGYDVADYCAIDPRYGTMEDFETLVQAADARGIGLMLDMVFNHTSTAHPWFQKALAGDPKYMNYYIWKKSADLPTNWVSKFGGPAWEYMPALGLWYLHLFDVTQADLNWNNPEVREELKKVLRFWKDKGVKGFRFDVVNLISKPEVFENDDSGDGRRFYTDGPRVHEFLQELVADADIADCITVGEMSSTSIANCLRYSGESSGELSMCFNFHHLKVDYKDGNKWELMAPDLCKLKSIITEWQSAMQEGKGWNAVFWCNHDQPRVVSRLGDDRRYRVESAKMLATCVHLLRGTPYVYQGEEIGMTNAHFTSLSQYADVESLNYYRIMTEGGKTPEEALAVLAARSRDNARTPMQWDGSENAGFTTGRPWLSLQENFREINAEAALKDQDSVFWYYKDLIALRKGYKAISEGSIEFLCQDNDAVFAYVRRFGDEVIAVFCNMTAETVSMENTEFSVFSGGEKLLGNYPGFDRMLLRPYECIIMKSNMHRE